MALPAYLTAPAPKPTPQTIIDEARVRLNAASCRKVGQTIVVEAPNLDDACDLAWLGRAGPSIGLAIELHVPDILARDLGSLARHGFRLVLADQENERLGRHSILRTTKDAFYADA